MKKINVNVDLNVFKRMMKEFLNGITFDDVYCYPSTDSDGKECYTTTVDILPLKTFSITDKADNYFYSRFLVDACGKEIDELRNKLSAKHFSFNAAEGKLVFTSPIETFKMNSRDFSDYCVIVADKTLESSEKICFHNEGIYYIDEDFEPINPFFLGELKYTLDCETTIKMYYDKKLLEVAKKYGFEGYVFDLYHCKVRFYSSKLPQGWKSVEDDGLPFVDGDNINSLEGIDYPSQRSTVAQQVANEYQNK